jgi:hypothetical protein
VSEHDDYARAMEALEAELTKQATDETNPGDWRGLKAWLPEGPPDAASFFGVGRKATPADRVAEVLALYESGILGPEKHNWWQRAAVRLLGRERARRVLGVPRTGAEVANEMLNVPMGLRGMDPWLMARDTEQPRER